MLKLLAFIVLILFFFRMIGFALRFLLGGFTSSKVNQSGGFQEDNKPKDGNVNIDYVPGTKSKKGKNFKGGDYVDYEELK